MVIWYYIYTHSYKHLRWYGMSTLINSTTHRYPEINIDGKTGHIDRELSSRYEAIVPAYETSMQEYGGRQR